MLNVRPNVTVLTFTLGVSVLTGVLFDLVPALKATRVDLVSVLIGPRYFQALGVPFLSGREFDERDNARAPFSSDNQ
jgi:hypothetical protein